MPRKYSKYKYGGSYSFGRNCSTHVAVAEKALGKRLPLGSVVHHIDEDTLNNSPSNLVVCPGEWYHNLLHTRTRAYDATGDANAQKCQYCGQWDTPDKMQVASKSDRSSLTYYHATCRALYRADFRDRKGYKI